MAMIKCKACGGSVEMERDATYGTCEYCGNIVTFPKISDEQRISIYDRGNHFRRNGDFDKALAVYEQIIREEPRDAEAHWCCVLCRFGIEYVEDKRHSAWIPTCHRASFDSILEDVDYQAALEYSDGVTRRHYETEAKRISEIQKEILKTSRAEEAYDVFICYKESDEKGGRTQDSVLAQDIYYQLTEAGYRVFYSRITLEDKVGSEYEPYIFAALHSARVMLVIGTRADYLNAAWVKNEWGRFLALMRKDKDKLLLPCYRDMEPYDMPEALSVLQAYDMARIGFIQDLLHGLKKVLRTEEEKPQISKETVVVQGGNANVQALLKRGYIELEDENWEKADSLFEEVLNHEPENAEAYLGKCLCSHQVGSLEQVILQEKNALNVPGEKQESLSINYDRDVVKMIAAATVDISGFQGRIKKKLMEIPVTYSSVIADAEQSITVYRSLLEKDKNLFRAAKYRTEGDKVDGLLKETERQFEQNLEQSGQDAAHKSEKAHAFYEKQFQIVQQEMEFLRIYGDCSVDRTLFANSKKTAEKFRQELGAIDRIYNDAGTDNMEETCQKIQSLSLELFDKEAEEEQWREVCDKWEKTNEENKKTGNHIRVPLEQNRQKLRKLVEEQRQEENYRKTIQKQIDDKKTNKALVSICIMGLAFLIPGGLIIHGIYKIGAVLIAGGSGILGILVTHFIGCIVSFFGLLFLGMVFEDMGPEVPKENEVLKRGIESVKREIEEQEKKLRDTERNNAQKQKSISLPKPRFELISPQIIPYQSSVALVFVSLDRTNIEFRMLSRQEEGEMPDFGKQAILFCYEKESFYPMEIVQAGQGEGQDGVTLTVSNQGLSIKLERFTDKEHYLLLLGGCSKK